MTKLTKVFWFAAVTLALLSACSSDSVPSAPLVSVGRIDVVGGSSLVEVGTVLPLTATVTDGNGAIILDRAVAWTSSDATIATVTSTGNLSAAVTGVGPGPVTISAILEGKSGSVALTTTARGTFPLPLQQVRQAFIYSEPEGLVPIDGLVGATSSYATAINDAGTVVGTSVIAGTEHGFLWSRDKGTIDLGMLPGATRTFPTAINDSGQVVGFVNNGAFSHAFRWSRATGMVDLGVLSGGAVGSIATSINNSGEIVGASIYNLGSRAYSWPVHWSRTGAIEPLNLVDDDTEGAAAAINDAGEIVGWTADGYYYFAMVRAVIWRQGSPMVIGSCGEDCAVDAHAISQDGGVAGAREGHAFAWTESTGFSDLGVLPGTTYSEAKGINDLGQVVLNNWYPNATRASVVTLTGSVRDLGVLPGKLSTVVAAINNKGQIVGYGQ